MHNSYLIAVECEEGLSEKDFIDRINESVDNIMFEFYDTLYDWYEIGGRWQEQFLVRQGSNVFPIDERRNDTPEGYEWAYVARKKDIDWDLIREISGTDNIYPYMFFGFINNGYVFSLEHEFTWEGKRMPFNEAMDDFIKELSDDTVLVTVDCHM